MVWHHIFFSSYQGSTKSRFSPIRLKVVARERERENDVFEIQILLGKKHFDEKTFVLRPLDLT